MAKNGEASIILWYEGVRYGVSFLREGAAGVGNIASNSDISRILSPAGRSISGQFNGSDLQDCTGI